MGKTRFGVLDLSVQARELQRRLAGSRVANVYDVNGRTYILKLSVPPARVIRSGCDDDDGGGGDRSAAGVSASAHESWNKVLLLIESGARIHTTNFERDTGAVPSGFTLKLRKHIRMRRLEAVTQLGADRIVSLAFSAAGAPVARLVVEFYAGGNIILTDPDNRVLALLRTVRARPVSNTVAGVAAAAAEADLGAAPDAQPTEQQPPAHALCVGDRYPVENARAQNAAVDPHTVVTALEAAVAAQPPPPNTPEPRAVRRRRAQAGEARRALAVSLATAPQQVEHALIRAMLPVDVASEEMRRKDEGVLQAFCDGMREVRDMVENRVPRGFLFVRKRTLPDGKEMREPDDVAPFILAQYAGRECEEFETFDDAVDEYFVRIEIGRAEAAKAKREVAAYKKVDKLTEELRGQVSALESAQIASRQKAQAIESNIMEVDAALAVVSSALAATVDWDDLARMVEEEKKNANPVAEIIHSLHFDRNEITLMLEDAWGLEDVDEEEDDEGDVGDEDDDDNNNDDDDEDDGDFDNGDARGSEGAAAEKGKSRSRGKRRFERSAATRKALLVDVDLSLSAHANAREYYAMKKTAALKMEKAVEAKDRTIKAASRKAAIDAQKMEADAAASSIRAKRKPHWFEKFHWMVSSENYLVVAGRDAQQNELLVKRYMGPGDAYVHADVHGASSVIVKNQKPLGAAAYPEIPRLTLEQAGSFAMCRSKAWIDKIVTSAWWVRAGQVSKTAPTGLSLPTGSFIIRGRKNFLDPSQLVMGFAFLFKVDESCVGRHQGERSVRGQDADSSAQLSYPTSAGVEDADTAAAQGVSANVAGGGDESVSPDDDDIVVVGGDAVETEEKEEDVDDAPAMAGEAQPTAESNEEGGEQSPGAIPEASDQGKSDDLVRANGSGYPAKNDARAVLHGNGHDDAEDVGASGIGGDEGGNTGLGVSSMEAEREDESVLFAKFGSTPSGLGPGQAKYGLEAATEADDGGDAAEGQAEGSGTASAAGSAAKPGKRRMSAKERRLLKSGKGRPAGGENDEDESGLNAPQKAAEQLQEPRPAKKGPPQTAVPRGKRSKLKKIKKKYGDQDELEREMALAVLGSKKVKELKEPERRAPDGNSEGGADEADQEESGDTKGERKSGGDARGDGKRPGPSRSRDARREKEEVMRLMEEEGISELSELEKESLTVLDMLTACPYPDDIVQYALPICAPYGALTGYRYRAKLLPGAMKRGKAYRASLALFLRQAEKDLRSHVQERDAMRLTVEGDAIQMMLGNVRVMAPGLADAQKSVLGKGKKKGGKK